MRGVVQALVTSEPLDADALERAVLRAADGALVTFRGVIRDHDAGRGVTALDYSAHPDATAFLLEACRRAAADGVTVAAHHRIGALAVGDVALVAVADDIKTSVPIWKRQHHVDGTAAWQNL